MKVKYKGENPICARIRSEHEDFVGEYHPYCCRWPKSCSSSMSEFYPEYDFEIPKKFKVRRVIGFDSNTLFDWMIYGYHPNHNGTITFLKYFSSSAEAWKYIDDLKLKTIEQIHIEEGL